MMFYKTQNKHPRSNFNIYPSPSINFYFLWFLDTLKLIYRCILNKEF